MYKGTYKNRINAVDTFIVRISINRAVLKNYFPILSRQHDDLTTNKNHSENILISSNFNLK